MDSWAEIATGADVSVWVMDEVIGLPSSWGQVFLLSGYNGRLFNGLEGQSIDARYCNYSNESFEHFYFNKI